MPGMRPISSELAHEMPSFLLGLRDGEKQWVRVNGGRLQTLTDPPLLFVQDEHGYRQATNTEIRWAVAHAKGELEPGVPGIPLFKIKCGKAREVNPRRVKE